jgi:hypothetical protein
MKKASALVLVAVAIFGFAQFNDLCYFLFVLDHLLQSLDDASRASPGSQNARSPNTTNKLSSQEQNTKNCKEELMLQQNPTDISNSPTDTENNDRNDNHDEEEDILSDCTTVVDEPSPTEKQAPIIKTKKTRRSRRRRRRRSPKTATTTDSNNDDQIGSPTTDSKATSKLDIDLELPEIHLPLNISLYSPTTTSHFFSSHPEAPSAQSKSFVKPKLTLQTSNLACPPVAPPRFSLSPIPSALPSFSTAAATSSLLFETSSSRSSKRTAPYSAFPACSPVIFRPNTPVIFNRQQPLSAIDSFSPFNSPVVAHKVTKSTLPWSVPAHMTNIARV